MMDITNAIALLGCVVIQTVFNKKVVSVVKKVSDFSITNREIMKQQQDRIRKLESDLFDIRVEVKRLKIGK